MGSNFPADILQKIETFAFHRQIFLVRCPMTIGARTSGRKLNENDQRDKGLLFLISE